MDKRVRFTYSESKKIRPQMRLRTVDLDAELAKRYQRAGYGKIIDEETSDEVEKVKKVIKPKTKKTK